MNQSDQRGDAVVAAVFATAVAMLIGGRFLQYVRLVQQHWVLNGEKSFAGIAPASAPLFIAAQLAGALAALAVFGWLLREDPKT